MNGAKSQNTVATRLAKGLIVDNDQGMAAKVEKKKTASPTAPHEDVMLLAGKTEKGLAVLRKQGETISAGELRPLEHGKSVTGEVVSLTPRPEMPIVFDVKTEMPAPSSTRAGPARVSTSDYREGWNAIWGRKKPRTLH